MVWDHLFGTYYNPRGRQASEDIGADAPVPTGWFGQLLMPLRRSPAANTSLGIPSPNSNFEQS